MTQTIVVASGKGGTGKTSVTAGVGCALAELGCRCLLIDADVGMQSLDMALGVHDFAAFDFADAARGNIALADAAVPLADFPQLAVLAAPPELEESSTTMLRTITRNVREMELYDFVLIDAPAGLGTGFQMAARAADSGILVATADPICLRGSERTARELMACGAANLRLVVNRVRPELMSRGLPNIDDAIDLSGAQLLGYVPEDKAVIVSAAHGIPSLLAPRSRAAQAYRNIARRLLGEQVPVMKLRRR
ncbi:MAG: AAA family ATPase [Clostridiaceae bacterium]|nr:AAA family ATPase [Clostridiaceae bacterium]MDD6274617.1 AAA family ATPase [Clostridiaceae bacterium]